MITQAHLFFNALLKADSIIHASGKQLDVAQFILTYRELYASHESHNPRGHGTDTKARHARNRAARKQYLIANYDRPLSEVAAGLGIQERTAAKLFSTMGVRRKWRN